MKGNLYKIKLEIEALVIGDNEDEARAQGISVLKDEIGFYHEDEIEVSEFLGGKLPSGWDADCYVYNEENLDITVFEALKEMKKRGK